MGKPGFDLVAYLKLCRFPLVFTAISDSAAGYLVSRGNRGFEWPVLLWLAVSSSGLYCFGMALNDIADRKRDLELAPGRPIPSARISLTGALTACLGAAVVSALALLLFDGAPLAGRLLIWGAAVFCIFAYDCFLKIPPMMGLVRALNLLLGGVSAMSEGPKDFGGRELLRLALPSFVYVTSLTVISTLEDKPQARPRLFTGLLGMILGAFLPLILQENADARGGLLALLLAAWLCRRAMSARDRKGVMLLVRDGIGGIIVLNATTLVCTVGWTPALGILLLLIPAALSVTVFKRLA